MDKGESRIALAIIGCSFLLATITTLYWRAIDAPFVADDVPAIIENESIRRIWPPWTVDGQLGPLSRFRTSPVAGRPLVNLSLAVNYKFGRLDPAHYRAVNILLHSLAAVVLWALVARALRIQYFQGVFDGYEAIIGYAVALLWATHPLVTEVIAYVTQRTELLASICYFTVLYLSLEYFEADSSRRRGLLAIGAAVFCWAGAASKEIMVTAPVMVLLLQRTFYGVSIREALRRSGPLYTGLFSSWLMTIILQGGAPHSESAGFSTDISPIAWWLTQTKVFLLYLKLAVWPSPLLIHYEPPYLTSLAQAWIYVVPVVLLAATTLVLLWRRSAVGYLLTFVFAILAPTFFVPIVTEIAAERRMYMPLAALITLFVASGVVLMRRVMSKIAARRALAVVTIALTIAGVIVSSDRLKTYADELTLWQDVLTHQPNDATAQYNVGTILLERGQPAAAAEHFRRAVELRDNYPQAHHNLGSALTQLGRTDEATRAFERAVEVEPRYALGHVKLGYTALQSNQTAEARREFKKALDLRPNDAEAHRGMAEVLLQAGELGDAIRHARTAIASAPKDAAAQNILGAALAQQGNFAEAVGHFETAVRLDPQMLQALGNLMAAYASLGRSAEAIATAEKALALARSTGDTSLEEQIEMFLFDYRNETANSPSPPPAGPQP